MSVLLVEDDANVRASVRLMLIEAGASQVYSAADGVEAIEFLNSRLVDVDMIVCDWNMPEKTGIEVLRDVRQTHLDIPFLLITARADQESVLAAKEARVTGYLRKPFTFSDLKQKLESIGHVN